MATLARLFDFTAGTPIVSNDVDSEFNQLVNVLNSTSTNVNLITRFSDAATAPLKLDQLGAGLIQEWAAAGVVVSRVTNAGSFSTSQQFISTLATGTKPIDVTSTTVCTNLNADKVDGLDGTQFIRNDTAQTTTGNLTISNTAPTLFFTDTDVAKTFRFAYNSPTFFFINDGSGSTVFTVAEAANVLTFIAIPELPASNPTTANQAARKQYVDDTVASKVAAFSQAWFYVLPPGATETIESVPRFIVPTGTTIKITKLRIVFGNGSHTSGGTLTWTIKRRNSAGTLQSDIGTITLDNTNGTLNQVYENDIGDVTLTDADQVYPLLTTRSGSVTEQNVTVVIVGTQNLT